MHVKLAWKQIIHRHVNLLIIVSKPPPKDMNLVMPLNFLSNENKGIVLFLLTIALSECRMHKWKECM
jgi:hypothetical protein